MYKKGSYIVARIAGLILLLILAGIFALQNPRVQSRLSHFALQKLESAFDGKITFSELEILPMNAVLIKDVLIMDNNPYISDEFGRGFEPVDTLLHARSLSVTFGLKGLLKKEGLHIRRVGLSDACMHLAIEPCQEPNRPIITNLERIFRIKKPTGEKTEGPSIFDIRKLRVDHLHYRMTSFKESKCDYSGVGLNYDDLDLIVDARGHNLRFHGSRMYAVADYIRLSDKCGYKAENISGKCKVGMGRTLVENIHLKDEWSDMYVKSFGMSYKNGREFRYFLERVRLDGQLGSGTLSSKTITGFTGALDGVDATWDIRGGHVEGYVNDLDVSDLEFTDLGSGIAGTIDAACAGLPDISKLTVDADLKDFKLTTSQVDKFISEVAPGTAFKLGKYAPGQKFTMDASASGPIRRLRWSASLRSGRQQFSAKGDLRNLLVKGRPIEVNATASTRDFDLGSVGGWDFLGPVTLKTSAAAILDKENPDFRIDSLVIDRISLLGNEYEGLKVNGTFSDGTLKAEAHSTDPDLKADITADCRLADEDNDGHYSGRINIGRADLEALGLFKDRGRAILSTVIDADLTHKDGTTMLGEVNINDIRFENNDGKHDFGDITAQVNSTPGRHRMSLNAPFLDATFAGSKDPTQLWNDISALTVRRDIPALLDKPADNSEPGSYDINVFFHDTRELLSALLPGLYIADGTRAVASISPDGDLQASVNSSRIAYGTNYIKGVDIMMDNFDHSLNATITGSEVKAAGIGLSDAAITAYAQNNDFSLSAHYDNSENTDNVGELYLNGNFARDEADSLVITAHPLSSYIIFEDQFWDFGESDIVIRGKDIKVKDFLISSDDQSIRLDGGVSSDKADTLRLNLNQFDLGIIDNFLSKSTGVRGRASGKALLTSPLNGNLGMLMNMICDSLSVGGTDAGSLKLASMWDDDNKRFNAFITNTVNGKEAIHARGSFNPDTKKIDATATFDELNLALAAPALAGVFTSMGGSLNGSISAAGPLDSLDIRSAGLYLDKAMVEVKQTGVGYYITGPLRATSDGLYFDTLHVTDDSNGNGTIGGALRYNYLKHMALDSRLNINGMKVLDLPEQGNSGFYGKLTATGNAVVSGPFNAIQVDANLATAGDGDIHVPLNSGAIGSTSDLLTFVEQKKEIDPYEAMLDLYNDKPTLRNSDFYARARVRVARGVKAFLEIEKSTGNVMTVSGDGSVSLDIRPSKAQFNLNGDYSIAEGNYHFVLPGILERDFGITEGSSIKFGGDIMDTELNVNTQHIVKTSLTTLLADTTAVATRRTVECGLAITDKIRNPQFGFSINVPDLDPTTKALVESALNTEDKVQKQFLSLLLFGTFFPSEQSGIVNGGNMLYSNVTGIMSNQLNSILQKLDIPLDFGLGYQQNQNGTDIFDVAVSTQLFNNKVLVNGSVGNRQYSTSTNPRGDMVGDLDIEIKLDNPGQFRVNLFSHSADEYTSFLDYSQRNGVGVSYQKEYNRFREILRDIFKPGKKIEHNPDRRPAGMAPNGRGRGRGIVTIEIEPDE